MVPTSRTTIPSKRATGRGGYLPMAASPPPTPFAAGYFPMAAPSPPAPCSAGYLPMAAPPPPAPGDGDLPSTCSPPSPSDPALLPVSATSNPGGGEDEGRNQTRAEIDEVLVEKLVGRKIQGGRSNPGRSDFPTTKKRKHKVRTPDSAILDKYNFFHVLLV